MLPELRFDQGDISILAKEGCFPLPIGIGFGDNFNGNIKSVNWPDISNYKIGTMKSRIKQYVFKIIWYVLPSKLKLSAGHFLVRVGRLLVKLSNGNPDRLT